jgi:hypothetical protein
VVRYSVSPPLKFNESTACAANIAPLTAIGMRPGYSGKVRRCRCTWNRQVCWGEGNEDSEKHADMRKFDLADFCLLAGSVRRYCGVAKRRGRGTHDYNLTRWLGATRHMSKQEGVDVQVWAADIGLRHSHSQTCRAEIEMKDKDKDMGMGMGRDTLYPLMKPPSQETHRAH